MSRPKPPINPKASKATEQWTRTIGLILAVMGLLFPFFYEFEGLSPEGHRVFGIFLMAIILWVSEAIPLFATATVIIFLEILLISNSAILPVSEDFTPAHFQVYFATLANPILMLFLGGFFLANGAAKYDLDRNLARVLLKPFGTSPKMILLALMLITALFSMFMSNTATTATMMAVVIPVLLVLPPGDRMRAGLALSIPVAANIGGIGTPIGTPPNAIALGALANEGIHIGFLQWMIMAIPLMVVTLAFAWFFMVWYFRSEATELKLKIDSKFDLSMNAVIFYCTFAITILLWFTEELHGMSSSIVGFFPVVVLLSTRVFGVKDLQGIAWHVLWLVAGGIALGLAVGQTGVDRWLIGLVGWDKLGPAMLVAVLAMAALLMGTFISHSATANLLVPIGVSMAAIPGIDISPVMAGVFIAIGSSLAMAFPISTPPNAIALSSGAINTRDMAVVGIIVGLVGWALYVTLAPWMWEVMGVMPEGAIDSAAVAVEAMAP